MTTIAETGGVSVRQTHVEALTAHGINIEKPGYRSGWQLMARTAQAMGVDVGELELAHLATNLGVMRAVDDLVDDFHQPDVRSEVKQVSEGTPIPGVTQAEAGLFQAVFDSYPPHRQERQLADLSAFPAFAVWRRQADGIKQLTTVNLTEASMFARILHLETRAGSRNPDISARQRFNSWLSCFSRAGYLVDTCIDLPEDRRNNNVRIRESNARARLHVGRLALLEAGRTIGQTPAGCLHALAVVSFRNTLGK